MPGPNMTVPFHEAAVLQNIRYNIQAVTTPHTRKRHLERITSHPIIVQAPRFPLQGQPLHPMPCSTGKNENEMTAQRIVDVST